MNTTEQNTNYESEKCKDQDLDHEYRMKQLDVKKQEIQLELKKIELDHQYRMKQLEYDNKKTILY